MRRLEAGVRLGVLLDVNTGLNRSGVLPEAAAELGVVIGALPGLELVGVFSYAGFAPGAPISRRGAIGHCRRRRRRSGWRWSYGRRVFLPRL